MSKNKYDILKEIRQSIDDECVSWGELAYLSNNHKLVKEYGDEVLAEWAGIPESEFYGKY